jgi:hypothetical protein
VIERHNGNATLHTTDVFIYHTQQNKFVFCTSDDPDCSRE